jgi:mitotic spindle assembly checkpoint protein MAD2
MGIRRQPRRTPRRLYSTVCLSSVCLQFARYIHTCRPPPKPETEIQAEIRYILKQIVSTVTFLPIIDDPTVFNILAYTHDSADVPADEWVDTDPLAIEASKSQQVKLRSFSTDVHRIEAMVAYRYEG